MRPNLIERDLSYAIVGAFYPVYNELGYGFLESVYSRALRVELQFRGIQYRAESLQSLFYRGVEIGVYRSDLIVESRVLVEIKSTRVLTRADFRQTVNYLHATGLPLALLLHFGPTAAVHRIANQRYRRGRAPA